MRGPAQFYLIKCAPLHLLEFVTEQQEQRRDDIFFFFVAVEGWNVLVCR